MAKRQYSDDEKAIALTYLDVNKGDVAKTARQVGVPSMTLRAWSQGRNIHPVVMQICTEKKGDLAERYEEKIHLLVDAINADKISEAPLQQLTTAIGILQDKVMALRGQANQITEHRMGEEDRNVRIAEILMKAQERRQSQT